jgi:hypothetical protein
MALKWSCFLCFRGGKGDLALGIVDLFAKALTNELELQTDAGLYRYSDEMVAGDIIDPRIASELNASACMIVLFTGKYFSKTMPYCAREYLAMTLLEKERIGLLPPERATTGLIVPVILRNPELFPPALKKRFWFDFTEFRQDDSGISKPKKFFSDVLAIAEYTAARYRELDGAVDGAKPVKLPNEKQTLDFLAKLHRPKQTKRSKAVRK